MSPGKVTLRSYVLIDMMQPQYAAFTGTVIKGDVPVAGDAELYVELAPGSEVFSLVDAAVKGSGARPGFQIVEREYGLIEIHSRSVEEVREAGRSLLVRCGLSESDRLKPQVVSEQMITNVDPYQAQLINRFRQGSLLVPGESLFIMEVEPAGYIVAATNECEKAADIKIVHFDPVGRYGRLFVSGLQSEVRAAREAALSAIQSMNGRSLT